MQTNTKKPLVIILAAVLVLVLGVTIWFFAANIVVGGHVYPKKAEFLNLRGQELTVEEFEAIQAKLPDAEIYWDIPFQGTTYPENTLSLTVTTLTDEDVDMLDHMHGLVAVNAADCTDYPQLAELQKRHPELEISYYVTLNGTAYPQNTTAVTLVDVTDEEIELLQYLPNLTSVDAGQSNAYAQVEKLQSRYPGLQVACAVKLCGQEFSGDTTELTVTGMTEVEAGYLKFLPNLTKVHLVDPDMPAEVLFALPEQYPDIAITWALDLFGTMVPGDAAEVEVTGGNVDVAELKTKVAYLPNMTQLFLNDCAVDNEAMAALREEMREKFKVVWTVACGELLVRTDATYFHPIQEGVYYFFDEDAENLRYCEDMICVDLGHMSIHDVSFVEGMPNLKYLILAHTQVQYVEPLATCKNLVFLEMDWSTVKDYSPLVGCTALEDLNLGLTYADVTPLLEMTWLKHLWIMGRGAETQMILRETFEGTETELYLDGSYTVGGGWRELPNYYAMRDVLGMEYMD